MAGGLRNINRCCRARLYEIITAIDELKGRCVVSATAKIGDQAEVTAFLGGARALEELKDFLINEMKSEEDET